MLAWRRAETRGSAIPARLINPAGFDKVTLRSAQNTTAYPPESIKKPGQYDRALILKTALGSAPIVAKA
jgi:hypothetical protein